MRSLFAIVVAFALSSVLSAQEHPIFNIGAYQDSDGAITLTPNGTQVEPYFATKALVVAQDAGLDTRDASMKWIAWVLAHQRGDGRIDRWCKKKGPEWRRCADADADDSMLALWTQLLYRNGTDKGLPLEWQQSADKALAYLNTLRNKQGVYFIARHNRTPLFMDNIEIYSAFKDISRWISRWDLGGAAMMHARSEQLATAIQNVFWNGGKGYFHPSVQKIRPAFYPEAVGQTYPWLEGMPTPQDPKEGWAVWKQRFADGWLKGEYDPHPWGLLALTALKLDDHNTAACWLERATPQRGGAYWNILEEASFQAVQAKAIPNPGNCNFSAAGDD